MNAIRVHPFLTRCRCLAPALAASVFLASAWCAKTSAESFEERVETDNALTSGLVTPHVPWGKGYARGKVRALFFVQGLRGDKEWVATESYCRHPAELAQRFDMEPRLVVLAPTEALHGPANEERAIRLLGEKFDVFVVNGRLDLLSAKLQYHVLKQVRDGAGLACFGAPLKEVFTPTRALPPPIPPFLLTRSGIPILGRWPERASESSITKGLLTCYRLGEGRGVHASLPLDGGIRFSFDMAPQYEAWSLFCGRMILWAAGRESDISFTQIPGDGLIISRPELPKRGLPVAVQSTIDQKLTLSLRLSLHGPGGIRSSLPEVKLEVPARGQASAAVDLPPLRAGRYLLGVIAVSERGTEAFGATTFQITSPASFDPVKLDQDFVEVGGTISGSAKLAAAAPPGTRLHVRLRDTFDRILAMQETDMAATPDAPVEFKLPVNEWATILMRAQAVLVDAQGDITQAEATFHVPRRRRGRFNFVMWEWPGTSPVGYYAGLHLRDRAGFTVVLSQSPSVPMAAACNMPCVPYTTRIQDTRNAEGIMEPICWNDDPAADAYVNEIADKYLPTRKQGVFVYSLGDEVATQGCCLSPACLRAYRRYLQEQYATIEALNRSWDSTYASFDDIDVLVKGDNYEKDAVQQGLFARWYDRQAFARHNMVNFCGRFHRAFQKRDPDAITGFEGSGGFGDDYDRILATNGFWTPYPSIGDEVLRSLAPRGYAHGIWSGYSRDPNPLIARNWRAITRGFDSIWWWRWDGAGRWRGYVSPNLDFWPATQQLTDEMRVVREGLGDLLIQCDMPHAGLAILYSLPSSLSSALEKSAEFGDYRAEHERWICAALDNQIPFRYVTAKQVREGVLGKAEFKLLILPFTQAVGPAEAKALSTFVEAGGTLVADIRPGVFDDHCKPQMPGALDDLFGIRRTGRASAKEISGRIEADLGGHKLSLDLDKTAADGDVALAAAKALATLDGVPLLTQRRMGKGMALLLNFRFPYNVKERHLATSDAARAFAAGIWASAGVSSPVRLRTKPGEPVRATEISRFTTGDVELLSVMPVAAADWSVVQELEIALAEDKDVYDLRSQKYLGRTREFAAAIQTGRATFFALLPYKAEQFAVSTDREAAAPGDTVTLALSLSNASGKGGTAAAFIEGTGPGGDALPYLRDVVLLRNGTGSYRFPIAYNQSPGTYRITARELFSGTAAETQCRVTR